MLIRSLRHSPGYAKVFDWEFGLVDQLYQRSGIARSVAGEFCHGADVVALLGLISSSVGCSCISDLLRPLYAAMLSRRGGKEL